MIFQRNTPVQAESSGKKLEKDLKLLFLENSELQNQCQSRLIALFGIPSMCGLKDNTTQQELFPIKVVFLSMEKQKK